MPRDPATGRFVSAVALAQSQAASGNPLRDAMGRFLPRGATSGGQVVGTGKGAVAAGFDLKFYPQALAALLRGPNGPVYRMLIVRAEKVKVEAQRLVGVYSGDTRFRRRKPGTLRDSIVKRPVLLDGEPAFYVTALDPIALIHHEGTEPHVIRAVRAPKLVFYWPKAGKVVAFTQVQHPGTKPNRFLVDALRVLGT